MKLDREAKGNVAVLRIQGNVVGGPESTKIHDEVKRAIDEGVKHFLVDLRGVGHMSSSGLGSLIASRTSVGKVEGSIKLLKPAARIQEILRITDLVRYFECFNEEDEALASFPG